MSSKAKVKGTRVENEIVKLFQAEGYNARRQPLSGAIQAFPHDVQVTDLFDGTNVEVKARKNGEGFTQLDKWKGSADLLILKKDRTSPYKDQMQGSYLGPNFSDNEIEKSLNDLGAK